MKILWLTNYPLPFVAEKIGLPTTVNEGWLIGLAKQLLEQGHNLVFCFESIDLKENIIFIFFNISFYGFHSRTLNKYNRVLKEKFSEVLKKERPEIIHIMGSEFPHSYSMYEACKINHLEKRCVISIQGLVSRYAKAYDLGIESQYKKKRLIWDLTVKDSILKNKKDYEKRGCYEEKLLQKIPNVIGRTMWDKLCVKQMNPVGQYFLCNEILRDVFYQNRWKIDKCIRHSIIVSQATYPVKGFHILLKAAGILKKKYDDLKIFVASRTGYLSAIKRPFFLNSDYANYIIMLIRRYDLEQHIEFLGSLDAENMCKTYLKSHVFVLPSTIENSSNSLGEAMLLGMPIVASYVGGLGSMMEHGVEGLFFPLEEEYMLAAYIESLFENERLAVRLGEQANMRAVKTHEKEKNVEDILNCYWKIQRENEISMH